LKVGRFFLNIPGTVSNTVTKLRIRYILGRVGADGQQFMTFRIDAAWESGNVYGFLLSFHMVDFVLALHAAAKGM